MFLAQIINFCYKHLLILKKNIIFAPKFQK